MGWNLAWKQSWDHQWHGRDALVLISGPPPDGLGVFVLDLEVGYKVNFHWLTGIVPVRSGQERQRIDRASRPSEAYEGDVWLQGDAPVDVRTMLAQYAAQGAAFRLAMTHEELLLTQDGAGETIYASSSEMALCDFLNPGQRVVVYGEDDEGFLVSIDAVVQSAADGSIVLDKDVSAYSRAGCRVAPTRPIYFVPEQNFGRFETSVELWKLNARAIDFDFAPALATLALGPLTTCLGLDGATLTERIAGLSPTVVFTTGGSLHVTESGGVLTVQFKVGGGNPTTADELYTALTSSAYVVPTGTWGTDDLTSGDAFGPETLSGGSIEGPVGTGATLDTYDGRPVWDWPIHIKGQTSDSIHAMTEIIDMGGVPYAKGFADMPDWGRAVAMQASDRYDWQWFKFFMTTVRGRQKSWWLPSWRNDLPFVGKATGTITVEGAVGTWYPKQRQHIQVVENDGTVTRAQITAATNNGDGRWTLTIGVTLASSSVQTVSWLELCRFERDDFEVMFDQYGFTFVSMARAIQP